MLLKYFFMPSSFKCTPNYLHHGKGIPIVIVGELLWRHPNKVGDEYNPKVVWHYQMYF
jgi:hypothetical protein